MSSLLYSSFHSAGNGPRVTVGKCPPSVLHTSPPRLCFIAHRHEHHTGFWWFACNLERVVTPCHKILLNVVWDFSFAQLLCWHHCRNAEDPQSTLAYHFLKISPYHSKSLFVILKCPPPAANDVNIYIGQPVNPFYLHVLPFFVWSMYWWDPGRKASGVPFHDFWGRFTQSKNPWRSGVWLNSGCLLWLIHCVGLMMEVDFTGAKEHGLLRTWEE